MNEVVAERSVLVTGFEPFAGSSLNPSQVVIDAMADRSCSVAGIELHTALLPVDTQQVAAELEMLWQLREPDIVLHLGESAKAHRLTLERVAINLLDFQLPDNAGQMVVDQPIDRAGPAARFVTLPVRALRDQLEQQHGIASDLSLSAGAYLCNQVLYLSLGQSEKWGGRSVGFVHLPSLPEQVALGERKGASMTRELLIEQVHCLLKLASAIDATDKPAVSIDPRSDLR